MANASGFMLASDVDGEVLLIAYRNLLSCRNVYFGVSVEKTDTDSLLEFPGRERAKFLLTLRSLAGSNIVGKFHNIFKESMDKIISAN